MSKTIAECVANQNSSIWSDFAMRNLTNLTEKFRVAFCSTKIHISTNLLNNGLCNTAMKCTKNVCRLHRNKNGKIPHFCLGLPIDFLVERMALLQCCVLFDAFFTYPLFISLNLVGCCCCCYFCSCSLLLSLSLCVFFAFCSVCVRKPSIEPHIFTNIFQFNENKILFWLEIHANPCTCTVWATVCRIGTHRVDERQRFSIRKIHAGFKETQRSWSLFWYYCCFGMPIFSCSYFSSILYALKNYCIPW